MVTQRSIGIVKLINCLNLTIAASSTVSHVPLNYHNTLTDPRWCAAMTNEFQALMDNNTWVLVPHPGANVVNGKWVYKHKYNSDGSLARYKAQ
jgi:hypothetical protein